MMDRMAPLNRREKHHDVYVALHQVTLDVKTEFKRAVDKHGFDNTPASPKVSDGEMLKILVEEVGEVARAMTYDEGSTENLITELIQVATMAAAAVVGIRSRLQSS